MSVSQYRFSLEMLVKSLSSFMIKPLRHLWRYLPNQFEDQVIKDLTDLKDMGFCADK